MENTISVEINATLFQRADGKEYAAVDQRLGILAFGTTVSEVLEELDSSVDTLYKMIAPNEDFRDYLDRVGVAWRPWKDDVWMRWEDTLPELQEAYHPLNGTVAREAKVSHAF